MNELQVKTINIKPAVIEFNHEEIIKELGETLKHYKGLVYTEDATTELRKTLAELRKAKSAISTYGVDTRRELNIPVKEFSDQIKSIESEIDTVIDPLDEQLQEYVKRERDEKLKKLEEFKTEFIAEYELNENYAEQIEIEDSLLNKSTSLKVAKESIEFRVKNLKMEQDQEAANKTIIETTVKLSNSENDLSLSIEPYIRLLEFNDVEEIKSQIESDAQKEVEQRKKIEQAEKERAEREKQADLERIKQQEDERIEQAEKTEQEPVIEEITYSDEKIETIEEIPFADDPFLDDPFVGENVTHTISVTCTEDVFNKLIDFLDDNDISWGSH